jgi:hypothetical protein
MNSIILLFVLILISSEPYFSDEIQKKAIVSYLKGSVKIIKISEKTPIPAKLGMTLFPGDKIGTGEDSKIELKLEDGANFRIGENSSVAIEELKQEKGTDKSTLRIMFGRIWMNLKKTQDSNPSDARIITPKVTAAVKGTTYRADVAEDGEAVLNVYDGSVTVEKDGKEEEIRKYEKIASKDLHKVKFTDAEEAKDNWVGWNKNRDKIRIMVVFTEKKNGQLSLIPMSEVIFAEELLKNYTYSVVDQTALNQIRENEKLKAALTEDRDGRKAAAAGLEFGADLMITGQVDASARLTEAGYGMYTGISDMSVRVVKCDTAEIVTAKNSQKRIADSLEQGAFNNAVRKVSQMIVESINNDLLKSWKKENVKGASLYVSLYNVTFNRVEAIRKAIAGIPGAKEAVQISFTGERALLTVNFAGDSLSLAEKIAELNIFDLRLEVVGVTLNRIEIEVK